MEIIVTLLSLFGITALVWLFNRVLPLKVCPICAGVSGTWLWLLAAYALGFPVPLLIPGILMGGSVVGIAYQVEKRPAFAHASAGKLLLWKTLFIPSGFLAVYSILGGDWRTAGSAAVVALVLSALFLTPRRLHHPTAQVETLEKKMKQCC